MLGVLQPAGLVIPFNPVSLNTNAACINVTPASVMCGALSVEDKVDLHIVQAMSGGQSHRLLSYVSTRFTLKPSSYYAGCIPCVRPVCSPLVAFLRLIKV